VRITPIIVRVRTPRLLLRIWRPSDAQGLNDAVLLDGGTHLRRWMTWVKNEPEPLVSRVKNLRRLRARALAGEDLSLGVFAREESMVIGAVGMHLRIGCGAGEIGYWIRADRLRHGFATEAASAVTRIGFEVFGFRRMEIHTDPLNLASAGVARSLGFERQVTLAHCVVSEESPIRDNIIWSLSAARYAGSFASSLAIEAMDRRGRRRL
jgi:RimJ/RimL family protein N-acetyltransferase